MFLGNKPIAVSSITPLGSPVSEIRRITPPGGFFVYLSILLSLRAAEFTVAKCPEACVNIIG